MSSATEFRSAVRQIEEAYEFMIAFAGKGIGREIPEIDSEEIERYLRQFREGLEDALETARAMSREHSIAGEDAYDRVIEQMDAECEEAATILELLIAQDRITSQQVDNINGMSVFQSVMMKLFFLDELSAHFD